MDKTPFNPFKACYTEPDKLRAEISRCIDSFNMKYPDSPVVVFYADNNSPLLKDKSVIGLYRYCTNWTLGQLFANEYTHNKPIKFTVECRQIKPLTKSKLRQILSVSGRWAVRHPHKYNSNQHNKYDYAYFVEQCPTGIINFMCNNMDVSDLNCNIRIYTMNNKIDELELHPGGCLNPYRWIYSLGKNPIRKSDR